MRMRPCGSRRRLGLAALRITAPGPRDRRARSSRCRKTCSPRCDHSGRSPGSASWLSNGGTRQSLGRFELLEQVGVGSFGYVFRARDTELGRQVAIKIPRAGHLASTEDAARFLREARSAAQLKHPGIVTIHETGQADDGTFYLVEEFVQGTTLSARLKERSGVVPRSRPSLIAAVCDALDCAHRHGVIHRDIKPANILLDAEGRPHLMDFGLAKREAEETVMTQDGQVLGTPAYMSPEQARGESHRVDVRTDIYSVGRRALRAADRRAAVPRQSANADPAGDG